MKTLLLGAALSAAALSAAAAAPTPPKADRHDCFRPSQWSGWRAPDASTVYLRVNLHDIYRLDLNSPSQQLVWPGSHLVSDMRGPDSVCSPIDLDLSVADSSAGFSDHLFIKAITKLTPEQVAAIPKKDLP